jgi:DNA-directed RNA polymerase specialized sigma24 family protein
MNFAERSPVEGQMPATRWTIIARLHSRDDKQVRRALDDLCAQYHYPLYCYIRLRGFGHHDAEDALHDFLARFLRLGSFQTAEEEKGKLRSYLLVSLQRFLGNWSRLHDHSREVCIETVSSLHSNEEYFEKEDFTDKDSPDLIFQRKWAQELLTGVLRHLREKYATAGKEPLYDALLPVLLAGGSLRGEDGVTIAKSLGISGGALRVALTRLLRHYREILESDVSQTVADREHVAEEIVFLKRAFVK